ncbi:hypothetical protein F2P81_008895 [Scophthalmus maximus]|uniref:Uncharacterized protein n=1 Tax=Scophthalmus maximus TaxID=52904 RepID=A0A6A4T5L1_SCOMX|nr:hypothetical protein F2P81_008895 [Scophthalmus maximus]
MMLLLLFCQSVIIIHETAFHTGLSRRRLPGYVIVVSLAVCPSYVTQRRFLFLLHEIGENHRTGQEESRCSNNDVNHMLLLLSPTKRNYIG